MSAAIAIPAIEAEPQLLYLQGKLRQWKRKHGFGFIHCGKTRYFAHAEEFVTGQSSLAHAGVMVAFTTREGAKPTKGDSVRVHNIRIVGEAE